MYYINMETVKKCPRCKHDKPLEEFANDKYSKDKKTFDCKKCRNIVYKKWVADNPEKALETRKKYESYRREYYQRPEIKLKHRKRFIEKKYKIKYEEYEKMVCEQKNLCYICNGRETQSRNGYLAVDHNHKTGAIRKLLCSRCNLAIGLLSENLQLIEKIKTYIIKYAN